MSIVHEFNYELIGFNSLINKKFIQIHHQKGQEIS